MARKKEGRPRVRVRAAASLATPRRRVPAAQAGPAAAVAQADLRIVAVEQR